MSEIDFNKPFAIETTMAKWNDIISFNQLFLSNYVFRGQGDASWSIESALLRLVDHCHSNKHDPAKANIYEQEMLREFKYRFPLYDSSIVIDDKDNVEWLALMQHYGSPTRLIDFTSSIFIALFFALDGSYDKDSVIWAVKKVALEKEYVKTYCEQNNCHSVPRDDLYSYFRERANTFISTFRGIDEVDEIIPIYPKIVNKRISIQQGLFLMPTNLHKSFEDVYNSFLGIDANNVLRTGITNLLNASYDKGAKFGIKNLVHFKITIPRKFKWELTQLLHQMNISAETLYPGLEGMAKSLACLHLREPNLYTE
jgi:hypothetical protein